MGTFFKNWVFNQLPAYYRKTDTNKNPSGEGTLQRYLRVTGDELDEEVVPFIENFLELLNSITVEEKFLPLLGSVLGYPPSLNNSNDTYRKILAYIIQIYKVKGTKKSFEIVFNLLGLEISIIEEIPEKKITYDMPAVLYDDPITMRHYDTGCKHCSGFWIAYNSILDYCGEPPVINIVTPEVLEFAANVICWLTPINAKFKGFIHRLKICQNWGLEISDEASFCNPPTGIVSEFQSGDNSYDISWIGIGDFEMRRRLIHPIATLIWTDLGDVTSPYNTSPITLGQVYEYQLRKRCSEFEFSPWRTITIARGSFIVNTTPYTLHLEIVKARQVPPVIVTSLLTSLVLLPGGVSEFSLPVGPYSTVAVSFDVAYPPPPITSSKIITDTGEDTGYFNSDYVMQFDHLAAPYIEIGTNMNIITFE